MRTRLGSALGRTFLFLALTHEPRDGLIGDFLLFRQTVFVALVGKTRFNLGGKICFEQIPFEGSSVGYFLQAQGFCSSVTLQLLSRQTCLQGGNCLHFRGFTLHGQPRGLVCRLRVCASGILRLDFSGLTLTRRGYRLRFALCQQNGSVSCV